MRASAIGPKADSDAASSELDWGSRTLEMSSWSPHENCVRSFRATRVESWVRHQASIVSASVCIVLAREESWSCPSEGIAYTQWAGYPASAFGARSSLDAVPHQVVAARAGVRALSAAALGASGPSAPR